jgi:hypothetical protein
MLIIDGSGRSLRSAGRHQKVALFGKWQLPLTEVPITRDVRTESKEQGN